MKRFMKKLLVTVLAATMLIGPGSTVLADGVDGTGTSDVYVSFGADLTAEQKTTVMGMFGITEADLANYAVGSITNADEQKYLGSYLSADVIGTKALSCVMVTKKDAGAGIAVTTTNISYCTAGMYTNALITAGIEDAEVKVAGPFSISGTAALVGAMQAYSKMTGQEISQESMDAAVNEIVVTGDIAESVGDSEKVEELVAYVKTEVVEKGLDDPEDIRAALDAASEEMGVELSDDEKQQIVDLMGKINDLDLDVDAMKEQATELYDKIKELDIDTEGLSDSIGDFFTNIIDSIKGFFDELFD